MSGSELPPLRPLAVDQVALTNSDPEPQDDPPKPPAQVTPITIKPLESPEVGEPESEVEEAALPWEKGVRTEAVESELRAFCRSGELVYAALVDERGTIDCSVCTVGSRPHNETEIGELVCRVFAAAGALGEEVGEHEPQGLNLQGSRWSYSLDPLEHGRMLFGIFSKKALPAIVRACAQKARPAILAAIESEK